MPVYPQELHWNNGNRLSGRYNTVSRRMVSVMLPFPRSCNAPSHNPWTISSFCLQEDATDSRLMTITDVLLVSRRSGNWRGFRCLGVPDWTLLEKDDFRWGLWLDIKFLYLCYAVSSCYWLIFFMVDAKFNPSQSWPSTIISITHGDTWGLKGV